MAFINIKRASVFTFNSVVFFTLIYILIGCKKEETSDPIKRKSISSMVSWSTGLKEEVRFNLSDAEELIYGNSLFGCVLHKITRTGALVPVTLAPFTDTVNYQPPALQYVQDLNTKYFFIIMDNNAFIVNKSDGSVRYYDDDVSFWKNYDNIICNENDTMYHLDYSTGRLAEVYIYGEGLIKYKNINPSADRVKLFKVDGKGNVMYYSENNGVNYNGVRYVPSDGSIIRSLPNYIKVENTFTNSDGEFSLINLSWNNGYFFSKLNPQSLELEIISEYTLKWNYFAYLSYPFHSIKRIFLSWDNALIVLNENGSYKQIDIQQNIGILKRIVVNSRYAFALYADGTSNTIVKIDPLSNTSEVFFTTDKYITSFAVNENNTLYFQAFESSTSRDILCRVAQQGTVEELSDHYSLGIHLGTVKKQ